MPPLQEWRAHRIRHGVLIALAVPLVAILVQRILLVAVSPSAGTLYEQLIATPSYWLVQIAVVTTSVSSYSLVHGLLVFRTQPGRRSFRALVLFSLVLVTFASVIVVMSLGLLQGGSMKLIVLGLAIALASVFVSSVFERTSA